MRRKRNNAPRPIDELVEVYDLFVEVMRFPTKAKHQAITSRPKPSSRSPLDIRLLDKKDDIDTRIKALTTDILTIMRFK